MKMFLYLVCCLLAMAFLACWFAYFAFGLICFPFRSVKGWVTIVQLSFSGVALVASGLSFVFKPRIEEEHTEFLHAILQCGLVFASIVALGCSLYMSRWGTAW